MPKQYPRELRERTLRLVAEHLDQYEAEYAALPAPISAVSAAASIRRLMEGSRDG